MCLQSMGLQRVGHDCATELITFVLKISPQIFLNGCLNSIKKKKKSLML